MLCGSTPNCGCSFAGAVPSSGALRGVFPSIAVTGTGTLADPALLALNPAWVAEVQNSYTIPKWVDMSPAPTIVQSGSVAATVQNARELRTGPDLKTITIAARISITGIGAAANQVRLSLNRPPHADYATALGIQVLGGGMILDGSVPARYIVNVVYANAGYVCFTSDVTAAAFWGATPNIALANGDQIQCTFTYRAA